MFNNYHTFGWVDTIRRCAGFITGNVCITLQWRHNDHDSVSNHQPHGCLLNRLFRRRSKKTSKLRVTGLCVGNSPRPVNSPHKGPVTRKMLPFDDVIMINSKHYKKMANWGNKFRYSYLCSWVIYVVNDTSVSIFSACHIKICLRINGNFIIDTSTNPPT